LVIAILFPFIADTSDWDWFYFVKTFSVIIPIIILSIAQSKFYYNWKWIERFHPFIPNIARFFLVLNIAEGVLIIIFLKPIFYRITIFNPDIHHPRVLV